MKQYVYGFDVGGTTVKIGLFKVDGSLQEKWEIKTNTTEYGKHILNDIFDAISKKGISLDEIAGYGFGVPGPVIQGKVVKCVNLGWEDYDLESEFASLVGNAVIRVSNDANVAALGEAWMGAARGLQNMAMITLGTGVGGGIIVDSKIVDGAHGGAGEIGHMIVKHKDGFLCNCGNTGCLETVASATGIKRLYTQLMIQEDKALDENGPSAKYIVNLARKGDPIALETLEEVTYYLGYACQVLSVTTNPDVIVIGGGVSKAGPFLINKIDDNFRKIVFKPVNHTRIVQAQLGNDAGIYGAASLALNNG